MRAIKIERSITNRDDVTRRYFNELEKTHLATMEDEIELARKIREGDKAALDRLVTCNLRFVISVAKKYIGNGICLNDLISEGNIGLIEAGKRFDDTKGFKFITYAVWWIRQAIMLAISNNDRIIRLPQNQIINITAINKSRAILLIELEREPTEKELSEHSGFSENAILELAKISNGCLSLDALVNEESNLSLIDVIEDKDPTMKADQMAKNTLLIELRRIMNSKLSKRECYILECFYGLRTGTGEEMDDIAIALGLSKERIRQLKYQALAKIKAVPQTKRLLEFLS